jgi:acyl-CoA thioester hydrolase
LSAGVEVWRGGVATWECDANGHLNVGFYLAKAGEALGGLAAELGMPHAFAPSAQSTLMVRDQHVRFLREAHAGARLSIRGGVVEIGEDDAVLQLLMEHDGGGLAASFRVRVVHVTAREARAFPWPERVHARAQALAIETPAAAAPRSLDFDPVAPAASGERAQALGLARISLGVIGPDDCDAFGRMKTHVAIARIADGVSQVFPDGRRSQATAPPGRRVGGAALEYRLVYLEWPRCGDRIEIRAGVRASGPRVRQLAFWLIDPDSGRAWASAQNVAAAFDLDSRKIFDLEGDDLAAWNGLVVPGLTL